MGLGAYVEKLIEFLPRKDNPSPEDLRSSLTTPSLDKESSRPTPSSAMEEGGVRGKYFSLYQFLEAYQLETTLDFNRVELERRRVLENLVNRLSEKELEILLAQSLAYRMGRLSFGEYYEDLKNLCFEKGIDLKETPAFERYLSA